MKTNYLKHLLVINSVCLFAGMAGAADAPSLPTPSASNPVQTSDTDRNWKVKVSGDYFRFDSTYQSATTAGGATTINGTAKKSGNLYGGTISVKPPSWEKGTLDFSYRRGSLTGSGNWGLTPYQSDSTSDQFMLLYKHTPSKFLRWEKDGVTKASFTWMAGLSYDRFNTKWNYTAGFNEKELQNNYQLELGLGYNLNFFSIRGDTVGYRMAGRVEGMGGIGGVTAKGNDSWGGSWSRTSWIANVLGRATVYNDLTFANGWVVFGEVGYQYQRYYYLSFNNQSSSYNTSYDSYYGPFARVGVTLSF